MPPLHSEVVTATLNVRRTCASAQRDLEDALRALDAELRAHAGRARRHGRVGPAVLRALRRRRRRARICRTTAARASRRSCRRGAFPSDPHATILEQNDVAVLLRSDRRDHIDAARKALFDDLPFFTDDEHPPRLRGRRLPRRAEPAEEDGGRRGRSRRGSDPGRRRALPRLHVDAEGRARAAADREPRDARLRRPPRRLLPRRHAHAPLAHHRGPRGVVSELRLRRARADRVPSRHDAREARGADGRAGAGRTSSSAAARAPVQARRAASGTAPRSSRRRGCWQDTVGADGTVYPKGTAIPQRADFNTLDNPFALSADPKRDQHEQGAGRRRALRRLQPVERRLPPQPARDGRRAPRRHEAAVPPRTRAQGFNSMLTTTHRQNFLVPPRRHRSFPLAEL